MVINEAFEAYTMTLGFFLNNRIWDLMLMTGVAHIPLLILFVKSMSDAFQGGDDEGDRGSMALRFIQVGIVRILVVVVFCLAPNGTPLTATSVTYSEHQCDVYNLDWLHPAGNKVVDYYNTATGLTASNAVPIIQGISLNVNGLSPRPPLWLELVQNYSSKATNAIVATMPCTQDIAGITLQIGELAMKTTDAKKFFNTFANQCYAPELISVMTANEVGEDEANNLYWMGAEVFTNNTYKERFMKLNPQYWFDETAKFATTTWSYDPVQDMNATENGYASPSCETSYMFLEKYIERDFALEIKDLESDYFRQAWTTLASMYGNWINGDPDIDKVGLNIIIKRLTDANNYQDENEFKNVEQLTDVLDGAKAAAGVVAWAATIAASSFAKMLANPTIAIIQCLVFAVAPIIILLSNYSLKTVAGLTVTIFGLEFTYVIFEICAWLDTSLLTLTASTYSVIDAKGLKVKTMLANAINMAYIMLPIMWFGLLGSVGFMASSAGQSMGQSAKSSGSAAQSSATGAATGGGKSAMKSGKAKAG